MNRIKKRKSLILYNGRRNEKENKKNERKK